jgi:hypothetical protein
MRLAIGYDKHIAHADGELARPEAHLPAAARHNDNLPEFVAVTGPGRVLGGPQDSERAHVALGKVAPTHGVHTLRATQHRCGFRFAGGSGNHGNSVNLLPSTSMGVQHSSARPSAQQGNAFK